MRGRMFVILALALGVVSGVSAAEYAVEWNGRRLALEPARISAKPINRVWPGKQRPLDQTRLAKFTTFDVKEKGCLTVAFDGSAPETTVYPLSKKGMLTREGNRLLVAVDGPGHFVLDFGTAAEPLHVFANPPDVAPKSADNVRMFGPGRHEAGVIVPKSGETIYLAEGAVVHAAVFVDRVRDVRICGRGILDFSGFERCDPRVSAVRKARGYPETDTEFACGAFVVCASTNVTVEGVIFRDAPFWNCIVRGESRHITVDNIKVIGAWRYNSDGVDVAGCEDVTVRNCFVRSFDDCAVVLDGYLDGRPEDCRNVTFEDNILWCDWGANFKVWGGKFDCNISGIRFRRNVLPSVYDRPFDIHCRLGCPRFTVKDVVIEDVEIDVTGPRLRPRVQWKDEDAWPDEWRDEMSFCNVEIDWPQTDTGNQGRARMDEASAARTSREFDDITFRRIIFPGITPALQGRIRTLGPNQRIGEVRFEDVPKIDFEKK